MWIWNGFSGLWDYRKFKIVVDKTVLTVYTVNIQLAEIDMRIFQKRICVGA